jgi:hypothetical protein
LSFFFRMRSGEREKRRRVVSKPDSLVVAVMRVTVLAPGGFVAGYLLGRGVGRVLAGCALAGSCGETVPVLIAVPTSILGMGVGSTLAASRVKFWWQGIVVWLAGIASMSVLVVLVGTLGIESGSGKLVSVGWLLAAVCLALATWWPARIRVKQSS